MNKVFVSHAKIKWTGIVLGALLAVVVLFLWLFDWNYFRPALARMISEKTGRPVFIDGNLRVHPWSWSPSAEVEGLTIKNPAWAEHDVMFQAKRITVSVSLGRLLRGQLVLPQVEIVQPKLDLERDASGRASWELGDKEGRPQKSSQPPAKIPTIRRLLVEDGKVRLLDRIRKLALNGSLQASDEAGKENESGFDLKCEGSVNAKPFKARLHGGPLIDLDPDQHYDLEAHLTAADINADATVSFPKPFDLAAYQVKFSVSGSDLADVYFLTGLALPNTPPYRLAADMSHKGTVFRMENLKGRLGSSDIEGAAAIETGADRPQFTARIHSNTLNIVDLAPTLGHPEAAPNTLAQDTAQIPPRSAPIKRAKAKNAQTADAAVAQDGLLLPDADLQVNRVRGMNADVTYHAKSVTAPKMPMKEVSFHLLLKDGVIKIDPLSFVLDAGRFAGSVSIDARKDIPESAIDMRIEDVDLGQFKSASKQPPLSGLMIGRLNIHGAGSSVHKLASNADGSLSVALPTGEMNDALAELTGIDVVKGLGLLLSQKQPNTQVRCGVLDFQSQAGLLNSTSVFIDTTNVLITGRGNINLKNENLDLSLQGDPKKIRFFRLRAPITLRGTLLHPAIGVNTEKLLAQAGVATALGTLLTPFAAALALIDPGLAKNKDCTAVIAEAQSEAGGINGAVPPAQQNPPAGAPGR